MSHLTPAIERLNKAHADLKGAFVARNMIEELHGEESDEMAAFEEKTLQPATDAISDLESRLAAMPARTQTALLSKIAALLVEGIQSDIFKALQADLDAYLSIPADPAVKVCSRFLVAHRERERMYSDGPRGNFAGPAQDEIDRVYWNLVDEMTAVTPTTPEGVALLAQANLTYNGTGCLVGTEEWAKEIRTTEHLMMQRLCEGAANVADGKT